MAALLAAGVLAATAPVGSAAGPARAAGSDSVVIAFDLPLHGPDAAAALETVQAVSLYLVTNGGQFGGRTVGLRIYDDSSSAGRGEDPTVCARDARVHLAEADAVVIGPWTPACVKAELPILSATAATAPLLIGTSATDPGLTRSLGPGEPARYRPSGVRSFARVVGSQDQQGGMSAIFARRSLARHRCAVLDDGTRLGRLLAADFRARAGQVGLGVVRASWSPAASGYTALFRRLKVGSPDCLYLAGSPGVHAAQLLRDKVAVLGSNAKVPVLSSSAVLAVPGITRLAAAQGVYATRPTLDLIDMYVATDASLAFARAYRSAFGHPLTSVQALYSVAALQVALAAVAASDGTRAGIREAVLSGPGITLPEYQSMIGFGFAIDPATGDPDHPTGVMYRIWKGKAPEFHTVPA